MIPDYPCQECSKQLGCIIIKNLTGWNCNNNYITDLEVCRIIDIISEQVYYIISDEICDKQILEIINNIRVRNDLLPINNDDAKNNKKINFYD
jgi:hypothetical protein